MVPWTWLALLQLALASSTLCARVMVVVPIEEDEDGGGGVLEIYDFEEGEWKILDKDGEPDKPGPKYRAESLRPGGNELR